MPFRLYATNLIYPCRVFSHEFDSILLCQLFLKKKILSFFLLYFFLFILHLKWPRPTGPFIRKPDGHTTKPHIDVTSVGRFHRMIHTATSYSSTYKKEENKRQLQEMPLLKMTSIGITQYTHTTHTHTLSSDNNSWPVEIDIRIERPENILVINKK